MAAFAYVKRKSSRAKKTAGESYEAKGKKPKLGSGKRFSALKSALKRKGAENPEALAAWIGRKKLGSKKMVKIGRAAKAKLG